MKKQENTTAWLVQEKVGKMRRAIYFWRPIAEMNLREGQEIKKIKISWELSKEGEKGKIY